MGYTIPDTEPLELVAGDSWQWTRDLSDYPASEWTLRYLFARAGDAARTVTATADGDTHEVTVAPADSADWTPGEYAWYADVSKGSGGTLERHRVDSGTLAVLPNVASGQRDVRTHAARVLAAIEAVIEGRATTDQASITIDGVALTRMPFTALTEARDYYRAEVRTEQRREAARRGRSSDRVIRTHFPPIS